MTIDTTINIKRTYLHHITEVSEKHNISRNKLIAMLLNLLFKNHPLPGKAFCRTKYQGVQSKKCWKTAHVGFSPALFERCFDIRKCCKFSVSLLIAMAIEEYIDILEKKLSEKREHDNITDNYQKEYVCIYYNDGAKGHFHAYWEEIDWVEVEKYIQKPLK